MRMDADADFILKTAPHHRTSNHVIGQNDREAVRVPVTPELTPEFRNFSQLLVMIDALFILGCSVEFISVYVLHVLGAKSL